MAIDLQTTYLLLNREGTGTTVQGGDAFWSQAPAQLDAHGRDWLVGEFACDADWQNWEMHPAAEEVVTLLEGSVEFLLEREGGIETIALHGRGTVLVPRGVWHTAKVHAPSRLLHITMGIGSQHRPVKE